MRCITAGGLTSSGTHEFFAKTLRVPEKGRGRHEQQLRHLPGLVCGGPPPAMQRRRVFPNLRQASAMRTEERERACRAC
ncbi:hypothetical protein SLS62_005837 [Diatrype stigma]|uniref:Uncharacterized protein n=1 Tax=Diatrype stigma TaxID=117547 RepID=A0AAN9YPI3_9PEZI